MRREPVRWPGVWTGLAVGVLGVMLAISAYALEEHASRGAYLPAYESLERIDRGPMHIVGVVDPGDDIGQPTTCTVSSATEAETIEVGSRRSRFDSIASGQRVQTRHPTLICDGQVSVTAGPVVGLYPLARSQSLVAAYLAIGALGLTFAGHAIRCRRQARRVRLASAPPPSVTLSRSPTDGQQLAARAGTVRSSSGRPLVVVALFLLALAGTAGMVALSAIANSWAPLPAILNTLLLVVVLPAVLGTAALLPRRHPVN